MDAIPPSLTPDRPAAVSREPANSDNRLLASDFETFLRLLTTQLKNQDPLNPIDSASFAQQLATFSSVEQQIQTNRLLTGLSAMLARSSATDLAGWVGMKVRAPVDGWFAGAPLDLAFPPDPGADRRELVVREDGGRVVQRMALPAGATELLWAGTGPDGSPLPAGRYAFTVEGFIGETPRPGVTAAPFGQVREARLGTEGVALLLEGGIEVPADKVMALRTPPG